MQHYEITRKIDAPRADAWAVLSDLNGYGDHAPNLSKTEVVAGSGEGAVRRCYNNAGQGWSETCTLWQPGRRYVMEVDTSDYPYPTSVFRGTFDVDDAGNGSVIRVRFDYKVKGGPAGRVLGLLMRPVLARICKGLLDSLEEAALSRDGRGIHESRLEQSLEP
jgi:hypothetical protein